MTELNQADFEKQVLQAKRPVLVDFFATWCPPCKMLSPIIEELAEELKGRIEVFKINVDQAREIAQQYNIMGVPTMIVFKNGKEAKRMTGLRSKEDIKKEIL